MLPYCIFQFSLLVSFEIPSQTSFRGGLNAFKAPKGLNALNAVASTSTTRHKKKASAISLRLSFCRALVNPVADKHETTHAKRRELPLAYSRHL